MEYRWCVCGARMQPDTGGYTCSRCFRRYDIKGELVSNWKYIAKPGSTKQEDK